MNPVAEQAFREIARPDQWCILPFLIQPPRANLAISCAQLPPMRRGGRAALSDMRDRGGSGAQLLLEQMR